MEFKLTKEQRQLKKDFICFAREQLSGDTFGQRDQVGAFSRSIWEKCGETRLPGLHVPEAYGGSGYAAEDLAIVFQSLAYASEDSGLMASLGAHMFGALVPLIRHGSEAQKQAYLQKLTDGTWIAASAMTESVSGSDLDALATTAVFDGEGYTIQGEKSLILNALDADVFLVYARTDEGEGFEKGLTCFVVDRATEGISVRPAGSTVGLRTAPLGHVSFDGVKAASTQVVGQTGGGARVYREALAWERAMLAAAQVGRMEHLLEVSIQHARTRKSGEQPIGKYQSVSHKITDMKMRLEVGRLLSFKAAWQLDRGESIALDASISKLFASESMMQSALDAAQIFGGQGFLEESGIGRSVRDALGGTIYAGALPIQRNDIARDMGLV